MLVVVVMVKRWLDVIGDGDGNGDSDIDDARIVDHGKGDFDGNLSSKVSR